MWASNMWAMLLVAFVPRLNALPTNSTSPENPRYQKFQCHCLITNKVLIRRSRQNFEFSRRFGPVDYLYSGSCDTTTQYETGRNSINMDDLILSFWSEPRSRPINTETSYILLVFDTELSLRFPMREGFPIDYGTSADILDKLRDYFLGNPDLDQRPCRGSISVRGNVKFAFAFEKVPILRVTLQPLTSIRAEGNTWPSRQLPAATIDSLIQEADNYMSGFRPIAPVPDDVVQRWGPLEGCFLSWDWSWNKDDVLTRLTWSDSRIILAAFRQYFQSHVTAQSVFSVAVQELTRWGECARVTFGNRPDPGPGIEDPLSLNSTRPASVLAFNDTVLPLGGFSAGNESSDSTDSSVSTT